MKVSPKIQKVVLAPVKADLHTADPEWCINTRTYCSGVSGKSFPAIMKETMGNNGINSQSMIYSPGGTSCAPMNWKEVMASNSRNATSMWSKAKHSANIFLLSQFLLKNSIYEKSCCNIKKMKNGRLINWCFYFEIGFFSICFSILKKNAIFPAKTQKKSSSLFAESPKTWDTKNLQWE